MHGNRSHPLLEQVPLTVSPFVNLPTAPTLPYTYRAMPSTLPPSSTGAADPAPSSSSDPTTAAGGDPATAGQQQTTATTTAAAPSASAEKPRFVVSATGHAAHPDDILSSCRALAEHVSRLQADAEAELGRFEARIRERELAEQRRLAMGWLESESSRQAGGPGADSNPLLAAASQPPPAAAVAHRPRAAAVEGPAGELADGVGRLSLSSASAAASFWSAGVAAPGDDGGGGGSGMGGMLSHQLGGPSEMAAPDHNPRAAFDRDIWGM